MSDIRDEDAVCDYLRRIVRREAGDGTGLIYGMGHAVYTLSDPRAVLLKERAREIAEKRDRLADWELLDIIERNTPAIFLQEKGVAKRICANVDLYSGLIYQCLAIPVDLYTPMFATARVVGWCAHRLEELCTAKRIIRPAYKNIASPRTYYPIAQRGADHEDADYVPWVERC